MKTHSFLAAAGGALLAALVVRAQDGELVTVPPSPSPETLPVQAVVDIPQRATATATVTLGCDLIAPIAPIPAEAPITVWPGSSLKIVTGFDDASVSAIRWIKNNQLLSTTAKTLEFTKVSPDDSGYYYAEVTVDGTLRVTKRALIRVAPPGRQPVLNLSSRATISPGSPMLTCGFVVAASAGQLNETKSFLVRAVGPTLRKYGVATPLAKPRIRYFDSAGRSLSWLFTGPNSGLVAAAVGAFPLEANSDDAAAFVSFPAGSYTIQVTSVDGGSGDVLLEIYEVPDSLVALYFPTFGPGPLPAGL